MTASEELRIVHTISVFTTPDALPTDCTTLHERARGLFLCAPESLDVTVEHWLAAGLPCPELGEGPLPESPLEIE